MARTSRAELAQREMALLMLIDERSTGREGETMMSVKQLAKALHTTEPRLRHSIRAAREKGLIEIEPRYLANGGQTESVYRLTPVGKIVAEYNQKN